MDKYNTDNSVFFVFFNLQELDKRELSLGYKIIPKPQPERYLRMNDSFTLRADLDSAVIQPQVCFELLFNL